MTTTSETKPDFRMPTASKWSVVPRAVADGGSGTIVATAEVAAPPERVFRALTSPEELGRWWQHPDYYHTEGWTLDLRVCGPWSVSIRLANGSTNVGSGEFAEIDAPRKLVMTRKFEKHPLQGPRETTITYRVDPVENGTRVTVRDEGFIGRSEAAFGNAEHWERVLGWLAAYLSSGGANVTASYTKTLRIQAPPRKLYEAVTTVPGIKDWWCHNTVEKNGDITVRFSGENFQTFRLLDPTPDKKIIWEWIAQYFPVEGTAQTDEWVGTKLSFDIQANPDGSSTLLFTHTGLTPQLICYEKCSAGWNYFLESLKNYVEQGTGTPYTGTA